MNSSLTPSTPQHRRHLSRDERIKIHALREVGLTYERIASELRITKRQVQYAILNHVTSPKKRTGRPPALREQQVDELESFVTSSSIARRMSYFELAKNVFSHWNVSERVIKLALNKRGYERRMARPKPALTEKRKRARLEWAESHRSWTIEQWSQILWTDETWVTGGKHTVTWITRKVSNKICDVCSTHTHDLSVEKPTRKIA